MCWGVREYCEICREETQVNWQGCENETEADDGGYADDVHPEPYTHPGFSDIKPVVDVQRVQYPEPVAYESYSNIENLPGAADELPSYEDAMNELALHLPIAFYRATRRHQQLMSTAVTYRCHINLHLSQNPPLTAIRILDLATETIETFLFEQEQLLSRINLLQRHLDILNAEIAALPDPHPGLTLFEQQRGSVIRELEGYVEQMSTMETAADWGARLEDLLCHVRRENQAARMEDLRDAFNGCR
ncbi:hypothetical protein KCU62_g6026, partial [Aureobasidium sp. EXF-3399]